MGEMYAVEGWRTDEDDEYDSYQEAVHRYDALLNEAEVAGWHVEHGWASRDNLLAARLTRDNTAERFLAIVRVDAEEDL
jgi:gamma-glutamyl:cysteine ligase YbdK (ATP-grasp superfamily)